MAMPLHMSASSAPMLVKLTKCEPSSLLEQHFLTAAIHHLVNRFSRNLVKKVSRINGKDTRQCKVDITVLHCQTLWPRSKNPQPCLLFYLDGQQLEHGNTALHLQCMRANNPFACNLALTWISRRSDADLKLYHNGFLHSEMVACRREISKKTYQSPCCKMVKPLEQA